MITSEASPATRSARAVEAAPIEGIRTRMLRDGRTLHVGEAGDFLLGGDDEDGFRRRGLVVGEADAFGRAARDFRAWQRRAFSRDLDYLILVPTLRCNLSCSYCQVSRVAESKRGFDWSEATLAAVLGIIDDLPDQRIKIEFQGGEPTLRPDLLRAVIERCARFRRKEFVICTNLQALDDEILAILDRPDVFVSTSLDGGFATHARHRTVTDQRTTAFHANLRAVVARYGPGKVSALPTIDPREPPEPDDLVDAFRGFGFESIFLRPINFQGFARKRHAGAREQDDAWRAYHERFVRRLVERNWADRSVVLEETYFSICLRRVFQPGRERHVDLRNPNPLGVDYFVVDHDGTVFPTDEARMLARSRVIDLSIGHVSTGWTGERRDTLNAHADNRADPTCGTCAYQPFCGRDLVDDISRYGRIDVPRHETEFCRRHMAMFDLVFDLVHSDDPAVAHSLARWLRLPGTPRRLADLLP